MKILFLSENYFPNVSGVPVVVRYLAEGLAKLGHNVALATSNYKDCPSYEVIGGINVFRFLLSKDHLDRYHGDIDGYVKFVTNFECDAIVFECLQCATTDLILPYLDKIEAKKILHSHGISGLRLKVYEKKKDLVHTAANTYHYFFYKWYFYHMLPKYINKFDKVIALSEIDDTIGYCRKFGIICEVLGNAVEDVFLKPSGKVYQQDILDMNKPYFLSVAYYNQIKNQIGILRQFYKSGIEDYAMVFIGPTENKYYYALREENKRLQTQYGKRNVLMLTNVVRSLIPDIIGNAKLYIVGSTIEQFSIAIAETMAKGVPFISTNVGNARLLPGGITVQSIDEMHKYMASLTNDSIAYNLLSKKGKKYVLKNCVREFVIKNLESIIKSI